MSGSHAAQVRGVFSYHTSCTGVRGTSASPVSAGQPARDEWLAAALPLVEDPAQFAWEGTARVRQVNLILTVTMAGPERSPIATY